MTIVWNLNEHYLDMMVCIGNGLGLGAMIPNQAINSLYQVDLDFSHPIRNFTTRYAKLGFNPKNSMLWIGKTPTSEDVWIGWGSEGNVSMRAFCAYKLELGSCRGWKHFNMCILWCLCANGHTSTCFYPRKHLTLYVPIVLFHHCYISCS